jgi:hypothetical protein
VLFCHLLGLVETQIEANRNLKVSIRLAQQVFQSAIQLVRTHQRGEGVIDSYAYNRRRGSKNKNFLRTN